nr:YheC/YheD family protein [Cohnella algarum]
MGILTLYLNDKKTLEERAVYEKMISAGQQLGLNVFVFTPEDVEERTNRIHAMIYDPESRSWQRKWVRFPHMIYDRCRIQRSKRFEKLLSFRRKYGHLTFLNRPLRNKWTVYRTLAKVSAFQKHLPATRLYEASDDVLQLLRKFSLVYLKPINGTGGRGILRIERAGGKLLVQGRDHRRRIIEPKRITREQLATTLRTWSATGDKYIAQQGLHIKLPNGRVHDYRMLVQKNGSGEWEVTGCAGRIGPARSITSNLHGGGEAAPMNRLLRQWVASETEAAQIRRTAETLGIEVARHLETSYGALCELALDLAIDRNGRVWLLEVNPKPAREVFIRAGERTVYRQAIVRPLEYALWLYARKRAGRSGMSAGQTGSGDASRTGKSMMRSIGAEAAAEETVEAAPQASAAGAASKPALAGKR